ncbi:MAG: glutamine-hydrolyzing carbamoyl-phosphate synthase small subunit [Treponema sp.]|nr:glutamine-hydrolyzing carbamoyl-phosphate synthase small subunit [Treponema sp.]
MKKAFLILADGTVFCGQSIGVQGKTIGETVFTTGMTGYQETLTDPSYFGQIVTQTFPLIGNYGVIPEDFESARSFVKGYIVRQLSDHPSNFRCQGDLDSFLKKQNIVGISGIDTRQLTKILRESGVMNGMIISEDEAKSLNITDTLTKIEDSKLLNEIREYKIENAVKSVQNAGIEDSRSAQPVQNECGYIVALWDFGAKANIKRELEKRGCRVTVVPCTATAKEILGLNVDGLMLSNGPGDPAENTGIIQEIKNICDYDRAQKDSKKQIAVFGICLGHQMLALAQGASTSKLKYGHRGGNHPVKDLQNGRVFITSQNHGYAVESASLKGGAKESFVNLNDNTCEGVRYQDIPAFSVQFHPEACGGPHDTNFLFDEFIQLMARLDGEKNGTK